MLGGLRGTKSFGTGVADVDATMECIAYRNAEGIALSGSVSSISWGVCSPCFVLSVCAA